MDLLVLGAVGCSTPDVGEGPPGCGVLCEARHIERTNAASVVSSDVVTWVKVGKTQIEQENSVASVCGDHVPGTQVEAGMTNELNSIPARPLLLIVAPNDSREDPPSTTTPVPLPSSITPPSMRTLLASSEVRPLSV